MRRLSVTPRRDWQAEVERLGFVFHTIDGEPYWDESAAYSFTLRQIEDDIEAPTGATFSIFRWLLWLSPLLVLIGMVLAISRSTYRAS